MKMRSPQIRTISGRVLILAGIAAGVAILLALSHLLNVGRLGDHFASFKEDNIPRFEATYRLEDWSYSILAGVSNFSSSADANDLRKAYKAILKDIVGLESAASDRANYRDMVSNLELNRLIEGLKHSLNTTLALKTAAIKIPAQDRSPELLKQISINEQILLQDLSNLRLLAIQNRDATFNASKSGLQLLQRRTQLDSYWVLGILIVTLAGTAFLARRLVGRMRSGLHEVSGVLRREQTDFSPDFFAFQDEFNVIAEKVQHYIEQEKKLRAAEAKAAASELRAEAYEEAIANLTHDLKTPATQMLGLLKLMEERNPSSTSSSREMKMAKTAAQRLLSMIQDVLDITRTEMDRAEAVMIAFDPTKTMEELISTFQFTAEMRGLDLRFDNRLTLSSIIQDSKRLERVMANLVDNAIKYTNAGNVIVKASNTPPVDGRSDLVVEVTDTGIGIPDEQLQEIFSKFSRAKNHFAVDGLGLGLALVSGFVELLGGSVSVKSQLNKGTSVTVTLPCEVLEVAGDVAVPQQPFSSDERPHILIVEDDPLNLALASSVLAPFARLTCAENGEKAVSLFRDHDFDLVIMDWRMPVLDGLSATREMRSLEREVSRKRTPIWGLTANASLEERRKALDAGMEDLLAKPLSTEMAEQLLLH